MAAQQRFLFRRFERNGIHDFVRIQQNNMPPEAAKQI
jgi:hypothetical protein